MSFSVRSIINSGFIACFILFGSFVLFPTETLASPPQVQFNSPQNLNIVSGNSVPIDIQVAATGIVSSVQVSLNGALIQTLHASPYTYALDTTQYSDANYILKAAAHDAVNGSGFTEIDIVIHNNSLPQITVTSPKKDREIANQVMFETNIQATNGVQDVTFVVTDSNFINPNIVLNHTDITFPFSHTFFAISSKVIK